MRYFEIVTDSAKAAAEVAPLPSIIPAGSVSYVYNYAEGTWTCEPGRLKAKVVCDTEALLRYPIRLIKLLDISTVNIFETVEALQNYNEWYKWRAAKGDPVLTFIRHDDRLTFKYQIVAAVNHFETGVIEHQSEQHLYLPPLDLFGSGVNHEPRAYPDAVFEQRSER